MFISAMLAIAAVNSNIDDIILGGLAQIPATSRLYEAIMKIYEDYKKGVTVEEMFNYIHSQYDEHTDPRIIAIVKELAAKYNETQDPEDYLRLLMSNPCGFQLTAGMTTNYRQLKTIYAQRRTHRLPEWREFCAWIETLPMAEFITCK